MGVGSHSNVHLVTLKNFRLPRDGAPVLRQMAVGASVKICPRLKVASMNWATSC